MDFLAFAGTCGPGVDPITTTALVKAESSFQPFAVRNNTSHQSFYPASQEAAEALVDSFAAKGDRLAIGLMQVTSPWTTRYGIAPRDLLNSCVNIRIGTAILAGNYVSCARSGKTPQANLECALSAYWSGNGQIGGAYVNAIYAAAGSPLRVAETAGVTDGVLRSKGVSVPRFARVPVSPEAAGFSPGSGGGFSFAPR